MDFFNSNSTIDNVSFDTYEQKRLASQFISRVYLYMFGALLVTGVIAYQYGTIEFITTYFVHVTAKGAQLTPLYYFVVFSPLGVALALQWLIDRLPFVLLFGLFVLYSVLLGFSLSTIFIQYTTASIAAVFGATSITFAIMAIAGYVTKTDLTKMGSILYMAFVGIIVTSIVNFWVGSDMVEWIISIIGVLVFTGLTAFHMQRLKLLAYDARISEDKRHKLALLGGFTLYVLFINLFLSLLSLFGERD